MVPVLIVDDDALLRESLVQAFKENGIATEEAVDGEDGLAKAKSLQPSVIVLDENMPKMTGQELVERMRAEEWGKNIPVVVLTIKSNVEDMNKKMQYGVSDYLDKTTVSTDEVVATAKKYLQTPPTNQ